MQLLATAARLARAGALGSAGAQGSGRQGERAQALRLLAAPIRRRSPRLPLCSRRAALLRNMLAAAPPTCRLAPAGAGDRGAQHQRGRGAADEVPRQLHAGQPRGAHLWRRQGLPGGGLAACGGCCLRMQMQDKPPCRCRQPAGSSLWPRHVEAARQGSGRGVSSLC